MSDLVTLNKNSECKFGCGRKNCANPGWPSWMSYVCMETAIGVQKARADAAEAREKEAVLSVVGEGGWTQRVTNAAIYIAELEAALAAARREYEALKAAYIELRKHYRCD